MMNKELLLKRIEDPIYSRQTKLNAIMDYCNLLMEECRQTHDWLEWEEYIKIRNMKKRFLEKQLGITL